MNTLVQTRNLNQRSQAASWSRPWLPIRRDALLALTGILLSAVVVLLAAWAATHGALLLLGAVSVGLGFVFIGLALEARHELAAALALTGVFLPVLGAMATSVAPEFGVLAGALASGWIVYLALRRVADSRR